MLALRELQFAFCDALLHGEVGAILSCVRARGVAPARRIAVYRNNVFNNYSEAMRAVYPVVECLVGEDFFAGAARKYIVAHPSSSGDLHDFGHRFGEFLDSFAPAAALPYLGDVARLEWFWHECFHAAEHPPLSLERLGSVPNESLDALRFKIHPACRLLASRYPVGKIWSVNQPDWQGARNVDLEADGGARLLIRRDAYAVVIEQLGDGEFEMLLTLARGEPLAWACELAAAVDASFELGPFLRRQVESGAIVDFTISPS